MLEVQRKGAGIAFITLLVLTAGFRTHLALLADRPLANVAIENLPMNLGNWQGSEGAGLDIRSQETLRLTRYIKREYRNPAGKIILVYLGYWQKQSGDYQAAKHSPALCLPSNGWYIEPPSVVPLYVNSDVPQFKVKRIQAQIKDDRYLFYYWFFTGEKNYAEEWRALLNISIQNFFRGRADGGIIEISTRLAGGESTESSYASADAAITDFIKNLQPFLQELIKKGALSPASG